jgi:hypothetical protein
MSDDHTPRGHVRNDLPHALGDVFVGESVEPISSDALGIKARRNREMVRDGTMASMESCVEAGNLKQFRAARQQRADRREVVWLMKRCQ